MPKELHIFSKFKLICFILLVGLLGYPVGYFIFTESHNSTDIIYSGTTEGVGVYVINLDRSKERYEYVKDSINDLGFAVTRISAVDGSTLSESYINQIVDFESYKTFLTHLPRKGTIGCSLSHIKTWETFLASGFEFALIFEDDITFDQQKLKPIVQDLTNNNELWDIVNFDIHHRGLPLTIKELSNQQKLVVYLTEVTHTGAYMMNREAAKKLLAKALPIRMPIDHYFTRAWEFDMKFTGVENPRLVHQTFGDSQITTTNHISEEKLTILEKVKHSMYKVQACSIRFLYNLKLYLTAKLHMHN